MELLGHEAYNLLEPSEGESPAPDPDAGKHAFEVFCDCIALDEQLVAYLIDVLKRQDRTAFYKLSQVTTHLDLDPREFLYWLSHREDYGSTDERACALIMDACFTRLYEEQQGELLGALLSGRPADLRAFPHGRRPSCAKFPPQPTNGTVATISTATIRCGLFYDATALHFPTRRRRRNEQR